MFGLALVQGPVPCTHRECEDEKTQDPLIRSTEAFFIRQFRLAMRCSVKLERVANSDCLSCSEASLNCPHPRLFSVPAVALGCASRCSPGLGRGAPAAAVTLLSHYIPFVFSSYGTVDAVSNLVVASHRSQRRVHRHFHKR